MSAPPACNAPRPPRSKPPALAVVLATMAIGCTHLVAQDAHTGRDGTPEGARHLVGLHRTGDRARLAGVVTYPGGDRVDWVRVDAPHGIRLRLELTWESPRQRPSRLAFDVFDTAGNPFADVARTSRTRTGRSTEIETSDRDVLVRVYAVRRDDAGSYRLTATVVDDYAAFVGIVLMVPDPPPLPTLPEVPPDDDR